MNKPRRYRTISFTEEEYRIIRDARDELRLSLSTKKISMPDAVMIKVMGA